MRPLLKRLASAAILSSISTLFISETIAKPQNARSRVYNEFHTDLFAKEPPLRTECPSWNDVVKGDTFDNEAFSAISKNGRPCFVNRHKYAADIADFSGNNSFGRNFSVYRTHRPKYYEIDIPIKFYTGNIGGTKSTAYTKFKRHFQSCIKNNKILLTDGNSNLRIKVPLILQDEKKLQSYQNSDQYVETNIDKNIMSINLHKKLSRQHPENFGLNITCAAIVHELLHVTGLHDVYEASTTYKDVNGIEHPIFDCRNEKDYNYKTANIMNYEKFFDVANFPIHFRICQTKNIISEIIPEIKKPLCDRDDIQKLFGVLSSIGKFQNVKRHINGRLKIKAPSKYFYIAYEEPMADELPPSLTQEQMSTILYTNNLRHPGVRGFARVAKNTYRSKYQKKGLYGGCRR